MLTRTVVCAVPTCLVGGGTVVVPTVVVVVVVVVGGPTGDATANVPFMPAVAWPVSVQRKPKRPFFVNETVTFADLPGASKGVFLPKILKSWAILPLFVTVKTTMPVELSRARA